MAVVLGFFTSVGRINGTQKSVFLHLGPVPRWRNQPRLVGTIGVFCFAALEGRKRSLRRTLSGSSGCCRCSLVCRGVEDKKKNRGEEFRGQELRSSWLCRGALSDRDVVGHRGRGRMDIIFLIFWKLRSVRNTRIRRDADSGIMCLTAPPLQRVTLTNRANPQQQRFGKTLVSHSSVEAHVIPKFR